MVAKTFAHSLGITSMNTSYVLTPKQKEVVDRIQKRIEKELENEFYSTPLLKARLDVNKALSHYYSKKGTS